MKPFKAARRRWSGGGIPLFLGLLVAGFTLLAPGQQPPPSLPTLRVEVAAVQIYCTVKTKQGGLVADLEATDFEIREDGKKQELRFFDRETDRPLTLALLVDTSISQEDLLPAEKEAALRFLQQVLRPGDLVSVISFDVDVDLLQDFTEETERLQTALDRTRINAPQKPDVIPRRGPVGTRLYDAVYLAAKEKLGPEVGRKAIILLSDGVDAGSRVDEHRALEAAQRSDTMIYAIGIADPRWYIQVVGRPYSASGVLKRLARESGGRAIFPSRQEELQEAFDQIAAELRSQYSLGYVSTNRSRDGRFRKIDIKVKRKGLRVQARRGYYAPES